MARIEQSIDVNVPVHAAYDQLTKFEQYPRFMEDMAEVRQIDDTHLHCHTRAGHLDLEWDAEITQQVPDRSIAWRHMHDPHYEGRLELQPLGEDKTRLTLTVACAQGEQVLADYGAAESAMARRSEHDLARFKMFVENPRRQGGPEEHAREKPKATQGELVQSRPPAFSKVRDEIRSARVPPYPASMSAAWQMWEDPFGLMRKMSQDFDQILEHMLVRPVLPRAMGMNGGVMRHWTPAVEVSQRDERLTISAELPGVKRDDVHVSVMAGKVTIEGERQPQRHQETQQYRRSERAYGPFHRVVALPDGADANQAAASLRDGVLEITMPVMPQGKAGRLLEVRGD
jgi:HSP20 family molecular chaperone IbpA